MRSPPPATRERFAWEPWTRSSAPARSAVRDRPVDRVAHPARRPEWDPELLDGSESRPTRCRRSPTRPATSGTLTHPDWTIELPLRARCVDQQAALAGAGCVTPGLAKATYGTGVFLLAHAGAERPAPAGGLLPTVAWSVDGKVEWAIDGGVFTAGALLEWLSRDLGLADDPPALAAAAGEAEDANGVGSFRRSPAWARRGGARRRGP